MITHCPSCHTHFRVHAEQLAARAGQVRCGKCSRVFDALEHLIEEAAWARASDSAPESELMLADLAKVDDAPHALVAQTEDVSGEKQEPSIAEIAPTTTESDPEAPQQIRSEPTIFEPGSFHTEAAADASASTFSFGPNESDAPKKHRGLWLAGMLLLLFLLLAQAAYQYRSSIILLVPETKPYAAALCAKLGCDLPLPRRIEMLSIEASDLQADTTNPSVMVLSATLKNRAIFIQQHPLLELTLTDAQDQPVVRRVLAPPDYLGKAAGTQAGFNANSELAIKVFIEGSQVKATGYRLYLFYP